MTEIFISYKTEDRKRVEHLVMALRAAGLDTWWDQDIPPGGPWRETLTAHLDAAALCVVAWSRRSTGSDGHFVREEANRAAARGTYIGVLIDPVMVPLGFAEWQSIDLSKWNGRKSDPVLGRFTAQIRARLENRSVGPAPAGARRRRSLVRPVAIAGAVLLLVAAALILLWQLRPGSVEREQPKPAAREEPTDFVHNRLASFPCSWLQISNYQRRPDGAYVALQGVAGSPQSVQTSIMQDAAERSVAVAELDVTDVATAPEATCAQLVFMRRYMRPGRSRLTIVGQRTLQRDSEGQWGYVEYELDLRSMPPNAILLGLDNGGGIRILIADLRRAQPVRSQGGRPIYGAVYTDENRGVRNVGLVLMTASAEINRNLVERIGTRADRASMQDLVREATARGWTFELGLVHCGFEPAGRRRC